MDFITWIIGIFIRVFSFDIYTARFVNDPGSRWSPGLSGPDMSADIDVADNVGRGAFVEVTYFDGMKFW